MDNADRIRVFEETMEMCRDNPVLADAIRRSIGAGHTINYHRKVEPTRRWLATRVAVTPQKTFECAKGYAQQGKVTVLNFADFYTPGGRVKEGSKAQEECLCRVSTLYPCIDNDRVRPWYYDDHIGNTDPTYNDDIIYTPRVIVFREDDEPNYFMSYDDWFVCDVITCAAPNNSDGKITKDKMYEVFKNRFCKIISTAGLNGASTLILGAFGCGAFGNDAKIVAKACYDAIDELAGVVGSIVLAVYSGKGDRGRKDSPNYTAFREQFDRTYFEAE